MHFDVKHCALLIYYILQYTHATVYKYFVSLLCKNRTEKEKEMMKYQADEAKSAMDSLARDKVILSAICYMSISVFVCLFN